MNGGPHARVSSPAPARSTLITSAPRSASSCPAQGPARMRASSTTRRPASGPGMSDSCLGSRGGGESYLLHAKSRDRGLVDVNAETGAARERHALGGERERTLHDVVGEIEMREADAPVDTWHRAGEMCRRGAGDARLRDLGGDVDRQAEPPAQLAGVERRADAAELDQLERDAAAAVARGCFDVGEGVDA